MAQSGPEYFVCPHCGQDLAPNASFCRHCGSSDDSGWCTDDESDFLGHDEFDYDEYIEREYGGLLGRTRTTNIRNCTAAGLAVVMIGLLLLFLGPCGL